jgi:energy-coupling factor transporter ATP-binding protein EcfA2
MLVADEITKHYQAPRGRVPVLDKVSFKLDRGEAMAITGPSGCGKSTLLYILGALETPSDGEVTIDGTNPYALNERQQASFRGATVLASTSASWLLPSCLFFQSSLTTSVELPWCSSRIGSGKTEPTPLSDGPIPRIITFLGAVPVMMKPAIRTFSPESTRIRVEILSNCNGGGATRR